MKQLIWSWAAVGLVFLAGAAPSARSAARAVAPAAAVAAELPDGTAAIQIDGQLTEDAWRRAPAITDFIQREPTEGAAPTHPTEVRVLFDRTALYVAVRAGEPEPSRLRRLLTRRDDNSPSDWIRVMVDSYHDRRTAFEFGVNAAGVKEDRYWFNDTNSDDGWDAVWDAAVARTGDEWRAEFRIPFSQLRFNPALAGTFGFAVTRTVAHNNETDTWPLLARSASGYVSSFGDLTGLAIAPAQKRLELMPYAVAQVSTSPDAAGNPLVKSPAPDASAGLDLKYKVGSGLTLTGTVNPDFGQVEADPAVVNLSGSETFFAERRPFFVEGSGNFNFDMDCNDGSCTGLFYSRRIGRPPHEAADAPDGGYVTQPANTTIFGAAKLTGRVGAFSIGALDAVTSRENATLATAGGARSTSAVEPATNYMVVRANREFTSQSRLGFMVTNTTRSLGADLQSLPQTATSGGVDGDWRLGGGGYSLTGYLAGSTVRGSADAISDLQQDYVHTFQRPDATTFTFDPARTALDGAAGSLGFSKISGHRVRMNTNVGFKTPGFDTNDIGYLRRADDVSMGNWWQIFDETPGRFVRTWRVNFNQWGSWNFDGDRRALGGNVNAHWVLTNNWSFGTGFNMNAPGFDDRLTRGGPGGFTPGQVSQWGYINSDDRRQVMATTFLNWSHDRHGSWSWGASPGVTYRPSAAMSTSVGLDLSRNVNDAQWVENVTDGPATHDVFGRLNQTTVGVSVRVNYTITPTLTVQIYAQPFVSTGGYTNFRELVNGRAPAYADRYAPFAYTSDPNFDYHSFRTTNVLRWEYHPGSALFVVWQQGREATLTRGDFRFARDFGEVFSAPGSNVFLVKISRWLDY